MDEKSDDDNPYSNTTGTPNGDEEVQSSVCSSDCRDQIQIERNILSLPFKNGRVSSSVIRLVCVCI